MANTRTTYLAKRRSRKEKRMSESAPIPLPDLATETVQQNLADARVQAEQPEIALARAYLTPLKPKGQDGLARRKAWLAAPVTPRVDRDENFPPWPSVEALLACAAKQQVGDPAIPDGFRDPFLHFRAKVTGYVAEIPKAETALAAIPKLTARDCERHPQYQGTPHRWGTSRVADYASDLCRITAGDDVLTDAARGLAQYTMYVINCSRNAKAAGVRESATLSPLPRTGEDPPAVTKFSPFGSLKG